MPPIVLHDPSDLAAIRAGITTQGPTCVWFNCEDDVAQTLIAETKFPVEETQRAERLRMVQDRLAYLSARAVLRQVLATYEGCDPGDVAITAPPQQKPYASDTLPKFSITHSHGLITVCFLAHGAVGCDLELAPRTETASMFGMAEHVFAPDEIAHLSSLAPAPTEARAFFLSVWRRKEAVLKAAGVGFSGRPKSFSILTQEGVFADSLLFQSQSWAVAELNAPDHPDLAIAWA